MAWVTLITLFTRTLGFATQIVLARLLAPADFGLLAIGLLAINTMRIFRDPGFGAALIYKKDDPDHSAANTAFILFPIVASVLFVLAYLSAPHIAIFFDNAAVEPIVRVLALTFVISSFGTVPSMLLEKELEFRKKVLPETVPVAGYACVTIGFALHGYGVWSLVYGQIVSAILMAVLIWVVSDWRPTFKFDRKIARDLFGYGKHIMGASIVIFLIMNLDDAIVGRMLGIEALGFYTLAYTISNLPATQITHLVGRVMFPMYSKLQDDRNALRRAYLKTLKYVSMLSIPAAFGIFVIAPDFVSVVLGEKWMPAVPVLQVLCFFGLFRSLNATMGPVFQATGKPRILTNIAVLNLALFCIFVYPFTIVYGLIGIGLAGTLPQIVIFFIMAMKLKDVLPIKSKDFIVALKYQIVSVTICTTVSSPFASLYMLGTIQNRLIISFILFSSIYVVMMYISDKLLIADLKKLFRSM